jgi:hypothetical protein
MRACMFEGTLSRSPSVPVLWKFAVPGAGRAAFPAASRLVTVEPGTSNARAAAVIVPACPIITNTRMSLRSGSFIAMLSETSVFCRAWHCVALTQY